MSGQKSGQIKFVAARSRLGDGQSHLGGLHMARVFNGQSNVLRRAERLEQGGVRAAAR